MATNRRIEINLAIHKGVSRSIWRQKVNLNLDVPIINLKRTIEKMINIVAENQVWIYQDEELSNNIMLRDLPISDHQTIEVLPKL